MPIMIAPLFRNAALAGLLLSGYAPAASAQDAPVRLRATIDRIEGGSLVVKPQTGDALTVTLVEPVTVMARVKATLADVKPGSYVGAAAVPLKDGALKAVELVIFPESLRGVGEGHRPMDLLPQSTMTNATVAEAVDSVDGRSVKLSYKDGGKQLLVPPDATVLMLVPGARADLVAGAPVSLTVTKAADGGLQTSRLTVDK